MAGVNTAVLRQFLLGKGLEIEGGQFDPEQSYMVEIDENFPIFVTMNTDERVAFFTFVADLDALDANAGFMLLNESLKLNSFKYDQPVQYCLDETGRHILAWTSRRLVGAELKQLEQDFDKLEGAYRAFERLRARVEAWAQEQAKRASQADDKPASLGARTTF